MIVPFTIYPTGYAVHPVGTGCRDVQWISRQVLKPSARNCLTVIGFIVSLSTKAAARTVLLPTVLAFVTDAGSGGDGRDNVGVMNCVIP